MNHSHLAFRSYALNVILFRIFLTAMVVLVNGGFTEAKDRRPTSKLTSKPTGRSTSGRERLDSPYRVQLTRVRSIDGSNQTVGGEAGSVQLRLSPSDYPGDGSGEMIISADQRANPRTISNTIVQQSVDQPNSRGLSNMIWAWGQFLDHDIDLTLTGIDNGSADIEIEDENDPLGPNPILFDRSDFAAGTGTKENPRTQLNAITSYIDASNVYGSDVVRAGLLRTFAGGRLRVSDGDLPPINDIGLPDSGSSAGFLVGDIRGNENVVLTSLHTLFVREHNRLCRLIALLDPEADDEGIYQLARKIVQAEIQSITYNEFLPALLGRPVESGSIAPSSQPGIATEFSTACYRFGHSTLSANIDLVGPNTAGSISLTDAFFNPGFLQGKPVNVDLLLAGLPTRPCQEIDVRIVSNLRTFLFGPPGAGGFDLAALNIQRGRDHGLADYNSMREAYQLSRVNEFAEITSDVSLQAALEDLYGNVDNIDAWVGGLAEDHVSNGSVGPLILAVLSDQFSRLRSADSFFYENDRDLKTPIVEAIVNIKDLKLQDIILANTTVRNYYETPFFAETGRETDVVARYDRDHDQIYIIGNAEPNTLWIFDDGLGISIVAGENTNINAQKIWSIPAGHKPHLTIDLGHGDDSLTLIGLDLNRVVLSLGGDNDRLSKLFTRSEFLASDTTGDRTSPRVNHGNSKPLRRASFLR